MSAILHGLRAAICGMLVPVSAYAAGCNGLRYMDARDPLYAAIDMTLCVVFGLTTMILLMTTLRGKEA